MICRSHAANLPTFSRHFDFRGMKSREVWVELGSFWFAACGVEKGLGDWDPDILVVNKANLKVERIWKSKKCSTLGQWSDELATIYR